MIFELWTWFPENRVETGKENLTAAKFSGSYTMESSKVVGEVYLGKVEFLLHRRTSSEWMNSISGDLDKL